MVTANEKIIQAIEYVVKPTSAGTNLALLHLIWAMVSGAFLPSRGSIHDALTVSGYTKIQTIRCWRALRYGSWGINALIERWREWVYKEGDWQRQSYEGWYAISCDVVVFPRLKLQRWIAKLYRGTFGRAVKAVGFGVIVEIGHYDGERVPLLRKIIRCKNIPESSRHLKTDLLSATARLLEDDEVLIHDAGASVDDIRLSGTARFVLRLAKNCVGRWNELPENAHASRQFGNIIRPLARVSKGKITPATDDPTQTGVFHHDGRKVAWKCWKAVVTKQDKVADKADPYDIWIFLIRFIKIRFSWRAI